MLCHSLRAGHPSPRQGWQAGRLLWDLRGWGSHKCRECCSHGSRTGGGRGEAPRPWAARCQPSSGAALGNLRGSAARGEVFQEHPGPARQGGAESGAPHLGNATLAPTPAWDSQHPSVTAQGHSHCALGQQAGPGAAPRREHRDLCTGSHGPRAYRCPNLCAPISPCLDSPVSRTESSSSPLCSQPQHLCCHMSWPVSGHGGN